MTAEERNAHEQEAERMKLLSRSEQRAILDLYQSVADDPVVSKANRNEARRRVRALKRLLKLDSGKRKK